MKKIFTFILMLGFLFVIASCSKKDKQNKDDDPIVDNGGNGNQDEEPDEEEEVIPTHYVFYNNSFNNNFFEGILEGNKALAPKKPTIANHEFKGWYYEVDGEEVLWDFNTKIEENVLLFAKWEEKAPKTPQTANEIRIAEDLDAIPELVIEGNKILLPERGPVNNIKLVWDSSNPAIITPSGIINRPTKIQGDKQVVLTASAVYASETWERHIIVDVEAKEEPVVTSSLELPFTNLTGEYKVQDADLMTFYVDDGNVPYVDVVEFLLLLSGLLESDELEFEKDDDLLVISYVVYDEEEDKEYDFSATLDFYNDTIFTEYKTFFSHYVKETETDYSEGINYVDTYHEPGTAVKFDLSKYQVDMFVHEVNHQPLYLMPFSFLNMIFTSETYYNVYYNGEGFFGVYGIPSSKDPEEDPDNKQEYQDWYDPSEEEEEFKNSEIFKMMKTSSLNNADIPYDVALMTFNQMVFAFDYYFGLRYEEQYDVQSFYEIANRNIDNYFTTKSSFNSTLRGYLLKTIDELHTSYNFPGYYNRVTQNFTLKITDLGPRVLEWYEEGVFKLNDAVDTWHGDDRPDYQFLDSKKETALIYLDSFKTAEFKYKKSKKNDSDEFMRQVLAEILAESPNVKNIGIDLSYNTGGNIGALFRVLGHITEQNLEVSYHNALDGANTTYFIEIETDALTSVNWFFVTSPVTFSAANLMTAIVKNQNLGLIIGSTSGGGACSITPILLADGTMMNISSNSTLSIRVENSDGTYTYTNIEYGVEPDVYLSPANSQNINMILDLVNQHYKD